MPVIPKKRKKAKPKVTFAPVVTATSQEKFFSEKPKLTEETLAPEARNAKITLSMMEWFRSWQIWQKKILITGIINRYEYSQLRGLLIAFESVFHNDFVLAVKKIYPVEITQPAQKKESDRAVHPVSVVIKDQAEKDVVDGDDNKQSIGLSKLTESAILLQASHEMEMTRVPSPVISSLGTQTRTTEGSTDPSNILSPIPEVESVQGESQPTSRTTESETTGTAESSSGDANHEGTSFATVARTAVIASHLMHENDAQSSDASTHMSGLSPIDETSPGSTVSVASDTLIDFTPVDKPSKDEEPKAIKKEKERKDKIKETGKKQKGKKKRGHKSRKSIPEEIVKRIASYSVLANRPVPSIVHLAPIGIASSVSLNFHSGVSSVQVDADDFFEKKRATGLLGAPVTTKSKVGIQLKGEYDFNRNRLPVPTTQQLYKAKKLWTRQTVDADVDRLKELFRDQLDQIWKWIDDWPAYRKTRLLLQLLSKSSHNMSLFAAECLKAKKQEADDLPPPIEILSDDLLLKVFDNLSTQELLEASRVCKRWYSIINTADLWKRKCKEIGIIYGISDLVQRLANAGCKEAIDWKKAFIEVKKYLMTYMKPVGDRTSSDESEESESEDGEDKYPNYIPFWKLHNLQDEDNSESGRQEDEKEQQKQQSDEPGATAPELANESNTPKQKGGFLQIWKDITEDIQDDRGLDDARSDACYVADMFSDLQEWEDVELLTNIGQRFAVDLVVKDAVDLCASNWPIEDHVMTVKNVQVYKGHTGAVNVVKFQGNRIFTGSSDRHIRIWNTAGKCFAKTTQGAKGGISDISLGDVDGPQVLFTASWDMSVRIWNSVTFELKATLLGHHGSVRKVAADNKFIISCSHDGTIKVWNRKKLKCERTITCHEGPVECMIYHNRQIMSGGSDKIICVSNSFTGRLIRTFPGHDYPITALKKQHDLLASGDLDGNVCFWSLVSESNEPMDTVKAHESQINAIYMHGPTFFTASSDALVKEWDLVTMTAVRVIQGHTDSVTDVQWTEKFLLTGSRDGDIRLWWWKKGDEADEFEIVEDIRKGK